MTSTRTSSLAILGAVLLVALGTGPPPSGELGGTSESTGNVPPVAVAGPDRTVDVGSSVHFDGGASYDPDITGEWTTGPPMPGKRGQTASAVVGDGLHVIGGYRKPPSDFLELDVHQVLRTDTMRWEARAPIPTPVRGAAGVVVDGTIRILGGGTTMDSDTVSKYDPSTDAWTILDPLPQRGFPEAVVVDGAIYLLVGDLDEFWVLLSESETWTRLPSPPNHTAEGRLVPLGSLIYLVGWAPPYPGAPLLQVFDTQRNKWSLRTPPSLIRCNHGAVAFRGLLVVISGEGPCAENDWFVAEGEAYDPRTDTWYTLPPIPTPRDEFAYGVLGDCIYTAGGSGWYHNLQYDVTEVYCAQLQFEWDFGDRTNASGEHVAHAYASAGTYTVTLTVTDPLGAQGVDTLTVTVLGNRPPVALVAAATGPEGSPVLLDASPSSDPDGDALQFRWDFDADGTWDSPFSSEPTASRVWGDDFLGAAVVEVTDGTERATASASVLVTNVAPVGGPVAVRATGDARVVLRVVGEKFHDVAAILYRDGTAIGNATVVRVPGSPDAQSATLGNVSTAGGTYSVMVTYTPLDDPVNGQPSGATPA